MLAVLSAVRVPQRGERKGKEGKGRGRKGKEGDFTIHRTCTLTENVLGDHVHAARDRKA